MKAKLTVAVAFIIILQSPLFAQNVGINNDGSNPDNSAMLHIKSTDKGLLIPQIALTGIFDIFTIPNPAVSLLVYNTTTGSGLTPGYYYFTGSVWTGLTTADGSETKITAGSNVTITGTGTSGDPYVISTLAHYIGESYGGGKIFWLDSSKLHGLIASTTDQSTGIQWYNGTYFATGATLDGIYAGKANTARIISNQGAGSYAAQVCKSIGPVNNEYYDDWYLPSKYELNLLFLQKTVVGGFTTNDYWSSTEYDPISAWFQHFAGGTQDYYYKGYVINVRAIRSF